MTLANTPFAGYGIQLQSGSGIAVVYVQQELLGNRLDRLDRLTEVIRAISQKSERHRVQHPHLYSTVVRGRGTCRCAEKRRTARHVVTAISLPAMPRRANGSPVSALRSRWLHTIFPRSRQV
ncbi:unnamed protein product [Cercospora beticola]|nr:unnamed protein product [Cercospora beticola]